MRKLPSLLSSKNRRKGSKTMNFPDLTMLHSTEVADWDTYLTSQFENNSNNLSLIAHEKLEDITFPLGPTTIRNLSNARVVLIIISPSFLEYLGSNYADALEIGQHLRADKTVAMLCGVQESDISTFYKYALESYDQWHHLVAKDRDVSTVNSVLEAVQRLHKNSVEKDLLKPGFKFVPRKVHPGNGKVYIILDNPIEDEGKKVKVFLEVNGMKKVDVKCRNPYNWHFVIPDNCMQFTNLLKVHVYCGDNFMGASQIKCESKMGELYSLLSTTNSPYELMCTTLGMTTLYDVDQYMAKAFRSSIPSTGFPNIPTEEILKCKKSKEELPTLLHFAARYGMSQLTKEIVCCPGALTACSMKNLRDLNPVQLACHHGHNNIASILTEFQKQVENTERNEHVVNNSKQTETKKESNTDCYDLPPSNPIPVPRTSNVNIGDKDGYLKMSSLPKTGGSAAEKLPASLSEKSSSEKQLSTTMSNNSNVILHPDTHDAFSSSQSKLAEIIKAYKKGATLVEVEKMHNEWKSTCQVPDVKAKQTLDNLRSMYAKVQKSKLNKKQSSSFSELRHFIGSKLRRKDSVSSKIKCDWQQGEQDLVVRPMSTLSVTSNTSSSSGSSFDAVSSASAGSDSGSHSDNHDYKIPCKYPLDLRSRSADPEDSRINGLLNDKPPAPPPRPAKTYIKSNLSKRITTSNFISNCQLSCDHIKSEYVLAETNALHAKGQKHLHSDANDPMENYDILPVHRLQRANSASTNSMCPISENLDYDFVPPPLPVAESKFIVKQIHNQNQPKRQFKPQESLAAILANYNIPDYDVPKTINYLSQNKNITADFHVTATSKKQPLKSNENSVNHKGLLESSYTSKNLTSSDVELAKSHYCNVFSADFSDDKIPDEMAPAPPIDVDEEHYKVVGIPVPIEVPQ